LSRKLIGHYGYYGITGNAALAGVRHSAALAGLELAQLRDT
jgi:hypothetical protein